MPKNKPRKASVTKIIHSPAICSLLIVFLLLSLSATPAETRNTASDDDSGSQKGYMQIGDITVTGKSQQPDVADLPTTVDVLGGREIENQNVNFSMELFRKVPGTYYGDWNQGVISGTFSMRGFDANHDAPATLVVDGIPHNFGYGRMDIQPYFPLEIECIEMVKGTIDPRYGLQNIAGNVNLHTKQGGNFTEARVLTGSHETYDAGMMTGRETRRFSQNYFVGYRQSDGHRDNSSLKKGALSGKWFYSTADHRLKAGVIARAFGMDADAPGYLTKQEAETDPTKAAAFARTDGGEQTNHHVSLHIDYLPRHDTSWTLKAYGQNISRTRWATFSPIGDQQERVLDDDQYGIISTLTHETSNQMFQALKLEWGVDHQYQENRNQRFTSIRRDRIQPERDWDLDQSYWGTYVQADGTITDWFRITAGLRVDRFDGSFENRLENQKSDMVGLGNIWQPKIGMIVTPIENLRLYANWGRTFQIPASDPVLYGQSENGNLISRNLKYSKNDGWETGIKVSPFSWMTARAAYWMQVATDEFRPKADGSGDYINAGETERKGWEFALNLHPHPWIKLWSSFSVTEATYTNPGPGREALKGNTIENIPKYTGKTGVDFKHSSGFFTNCWLEYQDDYHVDPQNQKSKKGGYSLVNLGLGYETEMLTLGFDVKNLTDQSYNAFVWNYEWGYGPGPERSFYAWVKMDM